MYDYILWHHCGNDALIYNGWQKEFKQHHQVIITEHLSLMPGIQEELRQLASFVKINIAGQYGQILLDILEEQALLNLFEFRLSQDNFTLTKPDPRYYEQILLAIGKRAEECVMVGDRIDKDVIPAKQVGMKTIRYVTGIHQDQRPRTPDEYPDREISSINQLTETVKALLTT